jgi:hypothetical protein
MIQTMKRIEEEMKALRKAVVKQDSEKAREAARAIADLARDLEGKV